MELALELKPKTYRIKKQTDGVGEIRQKQWDTEVVAEVLGHSKLANFEAWQYFLLVVGVAVDPFLESRSFRSRWKERRSLRLPRKLRG